MKLDNNKNMKQNQFIVALGVGLVVLLAILVFPKAEQTGTLGIQFQPSSITAVATTTVAGTSKVVLQPNNARKYAVITNTTATIAYLALVSTSTLTSITDAEYVIPLAASGGTYTINADNLYRGQVVASSSAAVTIRSLDVK